MKISRMFRSKKALKIIDDRKLSRRRVKSAVTSELQDYLKNGSSSSSSASSPSLALKLYLKSSALNIPIDIVADSVKGLIPVIFDLETGEPVANPSADMIAFLSFLQQPSPYFDLQLFLKFLSVEKLATGNSFLYGVGNQRNRQLELSPLSAASCQVEGTTIPTALRVSDYGMGQYTPSIINNSVVYNAVGFKQVTHLRNYSTESGSLLMGQSPILGIITEVEQNVLGGEQNINVLKRGNVLNTLFHFDTEMDDEEFKIVKTRIRDEYSGSNGESIAVTSGQNLDIKTIAATNKEMDFTESQAATRKIAFQKYKVPLVLGDNSAATFSNLKEARWSLHDDAVFPLANEIFSFIQRTTFLRWNIDPSKYQLGYDIFKIPALKSRELETLKTRRDLNLESINELRVLFNKPAMADADTIYQESNLIKLGQTPINPAFKSKSLKGYTLNQNRAINLEFKTLESDIEKYQKRYLTALNIQRKSIFADLSAISNSLDILQAVENSSTKLQDVITENYTKTSLSSGKAIVVSQKGFIEDLTIAIDEILETENTILIEKSLIDEETSRIIVEKVGIAQDQGLTTLELQGLILAAGAFSPARALRISRTISGTAASIGQLTGAKTANATKKTWLDSDFQVRNIHRNRDKEEVGIDERFSTQQGSTPRYPRDQQGSAADRVNCRCSMRFRKG